MSDYIELQNKTFGELSSTKENNIGCRCPKTGIENVLSEDEFDEEEIHIDEELDEYLTLYYNSLKVYDMMKSYVYKTSVPIYDNLIHMDVFELLYPNYNNDKYFF